MEGITLLPTIAMPMVHVVLDGTIDITIQIYAESFTQYPYAASAMLSAADSKPVFGSTDIVKHTGDNYVRSAVLLYKVFLTE